MEKKSAAVIGYGNVGCYVVQTLRVSPDFEIAGVVRRNGGADCPKELDDIKVVDDIAKPYSARLRERWKSMPPRFWLRG